MGASAITVTVKLRGQELQIPEVYITFQFDEIFEEVVSLLEEVFSNHPEENPKEESSETYLKRL